MVCGLINENLIVYQKQERRVRTDSSNIDEISREPIDQIEIFDLIRHIKDPERPNSLEELKVVTEDSIEVNDSNSFVRVTFTPTNPGCPGAHHIGLCILVKLLRSLPARYKIDVRIAPGTHKSEAQVNKQLSDKERVAAALEKPHLMEMIDHCLLPSFK